MNDTEILRRTSRSFFLTLRLLPRAVRGEASLGYLLARATDTLADTSSIPAPRRLELLRLVQGASGVGELASGVVDLPAGAVNEADRALLEAFPRLWREMHERDAVSRHRLETLLGHILEGQIFDLGRFAGNAAPLTRKELDRYTYMVAGSVGEFWTDLCADKLSDFSSESRETMRLRGRSYGQGLQLVNILRDRGSDAASGRVYVSAQDIAPCFAQARAWLEEGEKYCAALNFGRLRYATLLPCLLGLRTLALVRKQAADEKDGAKINRREVRHWMWRSLPVWFFRGAVGRLVRAASVDQGDSDGSENERTA